MVTEGTTQMCPFSRRSIINLNGKLIDNMSFILTQGRYYKIIRMCILSMLNWMNNKTIF